MLPLHPGGACQYKNNKIGPVNMGLQKQGNTPKHWRTRTNFTVGLFSSMPLCECEM